MEEQFNKFQTSLEDLGIDNYPQEIKEAFYDFITNVPYIKSLVSPDRPYAKDCPRDNEGKIIVDLTNPPIITDTDYFRPTAIHYQKYGCITKLRPNPNPNSEYGKWVREEIRRCYFGYSRPEDGAWITGDMYFFLNYCPIVKVQRVQGKQGIRVVDFPDFLEGQWLKFMYIEQARKNAKHGAELAKRGAGKAHPYDETIYTPNGKKLWGNLNIGDFVYGDDGNITKIIDIPFNGISPIYELELSNGNKVQCSEGHLWKVYSHAHGGRLITVTTKELLNIYKRIRKVSDRNPDGVEYDCTIPNSKGVEFPYTPTKIDPYTFGLLLGDGCFRVVNCKSKTYFTSSDEDFSTYSSFIPYNWIKYNNTKFGYNLQIPEFGSILKEYGLYFKKSEDKFIPEEYKYNSRSIRLNILKGILDSDGTVSKNGRIEIVLTSKKLIEDIKWILSSLGINYTKERVKHSWYYNSNKERVKCLDCYRLSIYSNIPLFNLPRKLEVWKAGNKIVNNRSVYKGSKIINIRYIGEKPAKCITVDNLSHCYLINNFIVTHNSYCAASILAKRFLLGEFDNIKKEPTKKVESFVASYLKNYLNEDGILNKFEGYIDFCAEATEFPRKRLISSMNNMHWQAGYKENESVAKKGSLNEVIGISVKDSAGKLRGKRGALIILEEFGSFPNLIELYGTLRPSMEDGDIVFGQIFAQGTAGDKSSDFNAAQKIMYSPKAFNMQPIPNVYDKVGQGKREFVYFYPAYINRNGCYNKDGISDVTKALLEVLINRYNVKYNTTDSNLIIKTIAEHPVVPQEAIMRTQGSMFPVQTINTRINDIENNPNEFDGVYIANLHLQKNGTVKYSPSIDIPIREFPIKDGTNTKGALEIFDLPQKDSQGNIFSERYILGLDPVDDDVAHTSSLTSVFVLDLLTDRIVAEYTGRQDYADDNFEIVRRLCIFYNAKCLYESNKKGIFAYFSKMNSLQYLAETPQYLKDQQIIKEIGYGNKARGVNATAAVNAFADRLTREWLIKPVSTITKQDGEDVEATIPNVMFVKNKAFLQELAAYNPKGNYDRVRAFGMLMLYRQEKIILYQGDMNKTIDEDRYKDSAENDEFFQENYDERFTN